MREKQRKLNVNTNRPTTAKGRKRRKRAAHEREQRVWPAHEAQAEESVFRLLSSLELALGAQVAPQATPGAHTSWKTLVV